jgi:SAM-dependent methyltransferase
MLDVARRRGDIEWVLGDPMSVHWQGEFDLIVMTGHAFQVFVEDDDLRGSLASIREALREDGRFVFETRNPLAREWERWGDYGPNEIEHNGIKVEVSGRPPVFDGELLSFTSVYTSPSWKEPIVSTSTLRFLDAASLASFLDEAGLAVEEQFGDWDRSPLTDASPEIISIVRRG